ncbi:Crocetin glucosyltransferase protein [Dioscorea alata]|uniref:Crocetin glucosyltransferase protein n=1 Tax=Dioscorea alata TaxID=55571 RepID=A0ACB7W6E8_DIOAL|nr:Crocetin glucosyltransferase protein [Dioscorea alata]
MQNQHVLIVTIGSQGQLNPARRLAVQLSRLSFSGRITLAIPLHFFRRLFPSSPPNQPQPLPGPPPHQIFFSSFSDGSDDGFDPNTGDGHLFMVKFKQVGSLTLSTLIRNLSSQGHPVTGIIYTIILSWVADIAGEFNIPSFFYWIQPASVFSIYYHYFTAFKDLTKTQLPGLPPLSSKDLPSLLSNPTSDPYLPDFELIFKTLNKTKTKVLVNSFTALESGVISSLADKLELLTIGPLVDDDDEDVSLYEHDDSDNYMQWLDSKEEGSVVYLSFGSLSVLSEKQVEEILKGLEESGRPFLWVLRKNNRGEGIEEKFIKKINEEKGKVVGWCSQVKVLKHSSVGCFVSHCGWNSMSEGLVAGVPMVMVPQWTDQMTNARLGEAEWRVGVRVAVEEDGMVKGEELRRCLEVVMAGEESEGVEIRKRAAFWKDKALEALGQDDGSSVINLKNFIKDVF